MQVEVEQRKLLQFSYYIYIYILLSSSICTSFLCWGRKDCFLPVDWIGLVRVKIPLRALIYTLFLGWMQVIILWVMHFLHSPVWIKLFLCVYLLNNTLIPIYLLNTSMIKMASYSAFEVIWFSVNSQNLLSFFVEGSCIESSMYHLSFVVFVLCEE